MLREFGRKIFHNIVYYVCKGSAQQGSIFDMHGFFRGKSERGLLVGSFLNVIFSHSQYSSHLYPPPTIARGRKYFQALIFAFFALACPSHGHMHNGGNDHKMGWEGEKSLYEDLAKPPIIQDPLWEKYGQ